MADKKGTPGTKKVNLKDHVIFEGKTYLKGTDVEVPDNFPEGDDLPESLREGAGGEGMDYESMTKADLAEEALRRGITVTRSDGEEGDPLKQDYIDALSK